VEDLSTFVERTRAGDLKAFGEIVRRFQDMAYGYAYSILGDFHLAEDAAQEAFIQSYRDLKALRKPVAPYRGLSRRWRGVSAGSCGCTICRSQ
jgi:DNA-directed RNA polymerase specialized sigma24 family protein